MVHGAPDYSNIQKDVAVYRLDDMAELAVRLGSPDVWDRRGDVYHIQDFEYGIQSWDSIVTGTGASMFLTGLGANQGGYCADLYTASASGGNVHYRRGFPLTKSRKLGVEVHFKPIVNFGRIESWIDWYDGSYHRYAFIRFNAVTKAISYKASDGSLVTIIEDIEWDPLVQYYHFFKWTVDFDNEEYLWLRYNERTVDMSGIPFFVEADTEHPSFIVNFRFYDDGTGQGHCRLDTIVLTYNEK